MPNEGVNVLENGEIRFWDKFENLIPDAVQCRFFSTAMGVANGRAREYFRESGPFLTAAKTNHLPNAIKRLELLKQELERLCAFYPVDDVSIRHSDRIRGEQVITSASKIAVEFEQVIVEPLDAVVNNGDESQARQLIESLREAAKQIARTAQERFDLTAGALEKAVAHSVVNSRSINGFVSCVSLDLAQYGAHTKVLHDYAGAEAILVLNRRIYAQIKTCLQAEAIPLHEVVVIDTGDGAVLIFTGGTGGADAAVADRAYRFGATFLKTIAKDNEGTDIDNQLHFRVGICSGIIAGEHSRVHQSEIARCRAGGVPIGTAVRLQTAARTGEIVACASTWRGLGDDARNRFDAQEEVFGKVHEKTPISAHRFACVPSRPEEKKLSPVS